MGIEDLQDRDWVLLPGTLCTEEVFTGLLDTLEVPAKRRRPVRLCLPHVDDYADTLANGADGAILCGFSLGAIVAARHLDRVRAFRTILFGVNPHADDPAKAPGRHALETEGHAQGGASALVSRLPNFMGPHPQEARAEVLSMADAAAGDIAAHTALALTGERDGITPEALGQTAANAADGWYGSIPGLGHYALLEDPALCAQCLMNLEESRT